MYNTKPSRNEIVEAIKYLKDNKAAGSESIAAELVNALNEMIQQVWIGETLPESWTEEVLCPVYKKGDNLDCKKYRGIWLLNVAYKVFAKVLHSRLLPYTEIFLSLIFRKINDFVHRFILDHKSVDFTILVVNFIILYC
jgi:hypothetical protein